jgi:glycosyltransferase involved in cell wall biosynthesis
MKISIVGTRGIPANYGGFETYAENLSVALNALGHEVTVACPGCSKDAAPLPANLKGIRRLFIYDIERLARGRYFKAMATIIYDLAALVGVCFRKPDVILLCGYASGPCMFVPRLFGVHLVVNPDGLEWNSDRWGSLIKLWLVWCEKLSVAASSALIVDAEPIAQRFVDVYRATPKIITYGAPIVRYTEYDLSKFICGPFFLCVARMVPETSLPLIIRAFQASASRCELIILGPITDEKFYATQVAPLLQEKVKHIGAIYDLRIVQALRVKCEALLHGHASEGTNPSLVESIACGSIVYAVDTASNRNVLGDGGKYFTAEAELVNHINDHEVFSHSNRHKISKVNIDRAAKLFSWEAKAREHIEIFEGLPK